MWPGLEAWCGSSKCSPRIAERVSCSAAAGGDTGKNVIVEGNCGRVIAATEAGDVANLNIFGARRGKGGLQCGAKFGGAIQMATHVRADAKIGPGWNGEVKMRIKTGDAVNLVERRLGALGK